MTCSADSAIICGGPNANSVYAIGTVAVVAPVIAPAGISSLGCWADSASPRAFIQNIAGVTYTITTCAAAAKSAGYQYMGLQNGGECWASNNLAEVKQYGASTHCTTVCQAAAGSTCGGPWANAVYTTGGTATAPTTTTTVTVAKFSGLGCWTDGNPRAMSMNYAGLTHTADTCYVAAMTGRYKYFALQYGGECWASNDLASTKRYGVSSQCTMACRADATAVCGGNNANQVYVNNALLLHSATSMRSSSSSLTSIVSSSSL